MIIINKKRIMLVITCVFISIFSFMYFEYNTKRETIQTVSLPVSNKVVVIDARTPEYLMKGHNLVMEQQRLKQT